ncbi:MAG TPA: efflux RND transporter periplasmic adaptor subunit, partial [Rhodanobacteraceae bacterium]|nr:efflux RND transporter periplasmic adaptor subunit [Rhodanobacteraceae bacterium]
REEHGGVPKWVQVVAAITALALVAGGAVWWLTHDSEVTVKTVTASAPAAGDSGAVLQATGYVTARRQATVSAQIIGTLTEVLIEEGDHVKQGQVLARLEDSSQLAYLNSAKAGARAAEAQVAQTRVQLQQAERDSQRQQDLVARGLAPKQQAEQARTQMESLRAQLRSAEAQAKSAQAQVAVAQVQYDYTVVRAPFAGVITQKAAQVGEIIAPSAAGGGFTRTGVGTIVDMDSLEVDVDVNEAYIGRVKAHMPAEAVLDAYPDWKIPAHVIAIVPAADRGKATVKVRVALEQKDQRIVPDMGVRVTFLEAERSATAEPPKGVLVPASAIVERKGDKVVFVLDGDHVKQQRVAPAPQTYGDMRLLPSGVAAGVSVVDTPPADLADGDAVNTARH